MEIELKPEIVKRIEAYVKNSRFESVDAFVDRAATLLLYAEDNKGLFEKMIKKQKSEE